MGYCECGGKFFEHRGFIYSKMRRYKMRMTAILVGNSRVSTAFCEVCFSGIRQSVTPLVYK